MYVIVYLLKMGPLPKKRKKKRKTSNFYLRHPIGLILLVAESKEYIYIYIYICGE